MGEGIEAQLSSLKSFTQSNFIAQNGNPVRALWAAADKFLRYRGSRECE